jgi:hypothetical protein
MRRSVAAKYVALFLFTMLVPPTASHAVRRTSAAATVVGSDVAQQAGVREVIGTWSANVADFNNDGWDDWLFVRHHPGKPADRLYRNDDGHFTEIDAGIFNQGPDRHDCAWGNVNPQTDGLPDVFCTIGANYGTATKLNELWIQQPDHTFVNRTVLYKLNDDTYGRGRNTTFIDANHDAYPDLFVGNLYPRPDGRPTINRFYLNQGGTQFKAAPGYGLDKAVSATCAQAADYNRDGWEDLLVCGKQSLKLYRNQQGTAFSDVSGGVGITGFARDALLADLNGDGHLDLAAVHPQSLVVRLLANGRFQAPVTTRSLLAGESIAAGDINNDGRLDLYVLQACNSNIASGEYTGNKPDLMLLNDGAARFSQVQIPQTTAGCGNRVAAIDYDNDGREDFIVLNGRFWTQGPVQLITF